MSLSWVGRLILALVLLAVLLVGVSEFFGLIRSVRQATRQAQVEAELAAGAVTGELARLTAEQHSSTLTEIIHDPRFVRVLADAASLTPSVVQIAVIAPDGTAVGHSDPSRIGFAEPQHPSLPPVSSLVEALSALGEVSGRPVYYQHEAWLSAGDVPYVTVRVVLAGAFLRRAVRDEAARGLVTGSVVIGLGIAAGLGLAGVARRRFRDLERGITALSEGRLEPIPESGVDEFARLTRGLNLIAARLAPDASEVGASSSALAEPLVLATQSRAVARLGELTAGVAHELRNELQAVNLDLAALRQISGAPDSPSSFHTERITAGLERLERATRGFLRIAGVRPPTPERTDLNSLLREARERFATEAALAGVVLTVLPDPTLPETQADPEVLQQAIQNLLRNSLRALVGREDGWIELATSRKDEMLGISVRDNGPGIPPEIRDRILDLYFTTRPDGSGVGLAVVRQSIEMHGGRISIASDHGGGTEVLLEIPWIPPA